MNRRLQELAQRKRALIEQCARERAELSVACGKVQSSLSLREIFFGLGKSLRAHPLVTGGISTLLASGHLGRVTKRTRQFLAFWKLTAPLRSWWAKKPSP